MEIIGRTDIGKVRKNNEDYIACDESKAIAVLADGMGGLDAGEVASQTAVDEILAVLLALNEITEDDVFAAMAAANEKVFRLAQSPRGTSNMGTTLVVWVKAERGQCFIAHVGDSRAYRLRGSKLIALTSDHSLVQQMVDQGMISESEALVAPNRNVVTRGIGLAAEVAAEVHSCLYSAGDIFLLCSDGLSDMISDSQIEALLQQHSADLEQAASELINAANDEGGGDNVSVVLIRPQD